jgi:hypothetical protein
VIKLQEQVAGWYKIEAVKADGSRRVAADWFPNLITDGGLNHIATNNNALEWVQVGTGSAAPIASDTQLASRVAGTNTTTANVSGIQPAAPYYGFRRITWRFGQGVAAGNLSEVGVCWDSTASLFSRALILDPSGSPTTITVLADEFLDVTYEFRRYPGIADITGTVTLDGAVYNWVSRPASVAADDRWGMSGASLGGRMNSLLAALMNNTPITSITSEPSGSIVSWSAKAYAADSHEVEFVITAAIGQANFNIQSMQIIGDGGTFSYQFGFTPAIPKDNTKILTLEVKHSWARKTI